MTKAARSARPGTAPARRDTPPTTLLYLMKQVELAVRAELDDLTRPAGLTALQYTALTVLERHPNLTSAHLARHSFVTGQSMSDMVSTLLDRELIERHRDEADRRRLVIALTPAGREVLDLLRPQVGALQGRMLAPLSKAQTIELRRALELCKQALHDGTGNAESPAEPAPAAPAEPAPR